MPITQIRLDQVKGKYGTSEVDQSYNAHQLSQATNNSLNDILSMMASSIKRINGGSDFTEMHNGQFNHTIKPSVDDVYYLGSESEQLRWKGADFMSGSIDSVVGALALSGSSSIEYSAPMLDDTISHNFKGVALELDSLAATLSDYEALPGITDNALFNTAGELWWDGSWLLNAPFETFKNVTKITSVSSSSNANSDLSSFSNWSTVDLSSIPAASRYNAVEVYVNGQLLSGGSSSAAQNGQVDYYLDDAVDTACEIYFAFDIEVNDIIQIIAKHTGSNAARPGANFYEQGSHNFDSQNLAAGEYSGEVVTFGSGTVSAGNLYTLTSSGWTACDADDVAKGGDTLLAIAIGNTVGEGMLVKGYYHPTTAFLPDHSPGSAIFISDSVGTYTTTAPSGTGQFVRIIGHCTPDSNIIMLNPEGSWLELN